MRGDFSRLTFRRKNHYSGVRLQQGRVQLDSEFNEHVDIEAYRDRETARDVIGRAGAPQDGGGFRVGIAAMLRGVAAPKSLWAVGEDGTVLHAAEGAGWALKPRPKDSGRLNAVSFEDDASGWAVGDRAAVYRLGTAATGSAEALPAGVTVDLHGVHAVDNMTAWAVGARGTVLGWNDGDWQLQARDTGVTAALRDVHFASDASDGCAVGDAGTIIATSDAGAGWEVEDSPPGTGDLHGVFVGKGGHRWAVGEQGTILFFDGTEWTRQAATPALTATLRAVAFTSATEGTAVGDGGTIVSTADGGTTWTREVLTGVTADLHDVVAGPGNVLIAVGDDVSLMRSAGGTWKLTPQLPADSKGVRVGRTLTVSAGDMYVDGIRCENERTVSLGAQPEPRLAGQYRDPGAAGTFGVYLQVQEQHLTAVEREELREVALGGPDTATRTRTVWQADLVRIAAAKPACADITATVRQDPPRGRLRARAKPAAVSAGDCIVPPSGGYERLENQLYRVEIHAKADGGGMSFKWSRDNGSVVARLLAIETEPGPGGGPATGSATVSHVGRDATLGFAPDQLVEITDEGRLLRGDPGVMAEVGEVDGNKLLLENVDQAGLTMADFPDRPLVRRWDGRADAKPLPDEHELESGVFVAFVDGPDPADSFRTGDYWTIPARTLSGAVEWASEGGVPSFEERHGPHMHLTPLGLVAVDAQGRWSDVRDCRKLFPPLTDLLHMYYVGGDGQQAMPKTLPLSAAAHVKLARTLQVGVANGRQPVAGVTVDFDLEAGAGRLRVSGGTFGGSAAAVTDESGFATCEWEPDGIMPTQVVKARLRDPLGQSPPQVLFFSAHLSIASQVAYDGTACAQLAKSPTVQSAIEALSRLTRIFPLTGSGEDVQPGKPVDVEVLVTDECGPVDNATVQFAPVPDTGKLSDVKGTTDKGIASCRWTPDPAADPTQHLVAKLESVPDGRVIHAPAVVRFTANLNRAKHTGYNPPPDCPELDGAANVQDAIDRLAARLPRLYHVSGNGLEGAVGENVALRAGVSNRCGVREPHVRFEVKVALPGREESWQELETVPPDTDGIATGKYQLSDAPRQIARARMVAGNRSFGDPVYFNLGLAGSADAEGVVPAARIEIRDSGQTAKPSEPEVVEFRDDSVRFDTGGMFDVGTDPRQLRAPRPGTYLAAAELSWDASRDGSRSIEIRKGDELIAKVAGPPLPTDSVTVQQATAITRMEADETVFLHALSGARAELAIAGAVLSLAWLGP